MYDVYYDAREPGSYSGATALVRHNRTTTSHRTAKEWLASQPAYTLHKPVRRKFPRRRTYSKSVDDLFQADLVEMQPLSKYNDNYRYILTCIDVLSKYAFAVPLKDKTGPSVVSAFEQIFEQRLPNFVQTDAGTEFLNHNVQELFKSRDVKHYTSRNNDIKAAVVERFNRTLKSRMYRYFTHKQANRWVDVLDDLIYSYNRSYHRSIGMRPIDVTRDNQQQVIERLYPVKPKPKWKFKVGDTVRLSELKNIYSKGYVPQWTREIFTISDLFPTNPVTYGVKDLEGEEIKGKFYEQELQKVVKHDDDKYEIEHVIKTRRRNGRIEYYVKWLGYPDKFNSWVTDVTV